MEPELDALHQLAKEQITRLADEVQAFNRELATRYGPSLLASYHIHCTYDMLAAALHNPEMRHDIEEARTTLHALALLMLNGHVKEGCPTNAEESNEALMRLAYESGKSQL